TVTALLKRVVHALQRLVPHPGDQMLVLGVLTAILLAAGGTVVIVRSAPTTTTTAAPVAPTALPASAHKVNLGGDVHPIVPATQIGRIVIPKINLDHPIFEGVDETVIHWGPGHWPGSAMPGKVGNSVFAGHRVTHTRPFYDIDLLNPGDDIIVHTADGTFTYKVTGHQIVTPKDTWIVNPTATATITIFACHPKHSAAQRYVVRGDLVA